MARERKLEIGAINITMQPHSPQRYVWLFQEAHRLRKSIRIRGNRFGIIAYVQRTQEEYGGINPITGDILCYTNIDVNGDWYNISTHELATEDDLSGVNLPEHLKPNSVRFTYKFYPDVHLLFYEGYFDSHSLGAKSAESFFNRLLNQDELVDIFGPIEVTHITAAERFNEALAMDVLEVLTLQVKRPNPDSQAQRTREVLDRMRSRNIGILETTYKSIANESIVVDEDLRTDAIIAANNGSVKARGKDINGRPKKFSTDDHPDRETVYYDPEVEAAHGVFATAVESMRRKILVWLQR